MERLAAGHDTALNDLMERHATPVFHFLCRMLGNEDDANDLAQETFVRVFHARAAVFGRTKNFPPGSTPSPRIWRETISAGARGIRTFRSKLKPENRNKRSAARLPADDPAPNEQALAAERAAAVRAAVGKLPEDLREAIVLCEWEESQHGRSGGDFGNDAESRGIAALSRPADFARTVEVVVVNYSGCDCGKKIAAGRFP